MAYYTRRIKTVPRNVNENIKKMKNKIQIVKAFKYNGELFNNKKEVNSYIEQQEDHKKMLADLSDKKRLDNPETFTIKEGYFEFFVISTKKVGSDETYAYKTRSLKSALNKVLKLKDISLDYECEILDKNKKRTGVFIDLNNMPKEHEVHQYI